MFSNIFRYHIPVTLSSNVLTTIFFKNILKKIQEFFFFEKWLVNKSLYTKVVATLVKKEYTCTFYTLQKLDIKLGHFK